MTTRTIKLDEYPLSLYSNVEYVKNDPRIDDDDVQVAGSIVQDTRESERMDIDQT